MRLLFIRHTSVDVPKGVCYGQTDVPLASTFSIEAEKVKKELEKYDIDMAFTSPLSRCRKLAEYCGFSNAMPDKRLMEMDFGNWEMKRYDDIRDPRLQQWYDDFLNQPAGGGESAMMQRQRFSDFLKDLQSCNDNSTIAIFTHGGILIHALAILEGMSYEEAYSKSLPYGTILEISK